MPPDNRGTISKSREKVHQMKRNGSGGGGYCMWMEQGGQSACSQRRAGRRAEAESQIRQLRLSLGRLLTNDASEAYKTHLQVRQNE